MNRRTGFLLFAGVAFVLAASLFATLRAGAADPKSTKPRHGARESPVATFMRAKLASSQDALEGLMTEDFEKIKKGADQMFVMSKAAEWQVIQGPVYAQYSAEFRRTATQLSKMAADKNIDGASLAYVQLTMSCISCHKYVKGTKIARREPIEGQSLASAPVAAAIK